MRPERLELEGFTTFKERTVVDFTGVELCAFTGPTGSGKSSLIDGMIFALYGCMPRLADRRLVAPVINQQSVEARVALTFTVGEERFVAVRVVRNLTGGGATTKEARLERLPKRSPLEPPTPDAGYAGEVIAGDAEGVSGAVTALLGMTYEHFTTCVVLPQGDFTRFLHNKPRDRQALLIELLDLGSYGQMARLAGERAAAVKARRVVAETRHADLGDLAPARRVALTTRLGSLDALTEACSSVQDRLDELTDQARAAEAQRKQARHTLGLLEVLQIPSTIDGFATELRVVDEALKHALRAVEDAEVTVLEAEGLAAGLPSVEALEATLAQLRERSTQERLLARGEATLDQAKGEVDASEQVLAAASSNATESAAELDRARQFDLAATIAVGLHAGERCPVCSQIVTEMPMHAVADVRAAAVRAERAVSAHRDAERAAGQAREERARVQEKLLAVRSRFAELDAATHGVDVAELGVQAEQANAAQQALGMSRQRLAAAREEQRDARSARSRLDSALGEAWAALNQARDAVAPLGPPVVSVTNIALGWRTLAQWSATQKPLAIQAEQIATEVAQQATHEARTLLDRLKADAAALGVAPGTERIRDRVVAAGTQAAARVERFDQDSSLAAALLLHISDTMSQEQVATSLARHLQSNGFQKWLLDEALQRLVSAATVTLFELSSGAYSLGLDHKAATFTVVDHRNGDSVRSARTLSGGETFLASVALALALADQVVDLAAAGAVRIESIFLDEGFGTLDADTLDVVATAIEELGSGGRMVCLVSHVSELAERLPVRFEVNKTSTGSSVRRVDL